MASVASFTVDGDTRAAISFLQRWSPAGPWVLTAIVPDGHTETVTFKASDWVRVAEWIDGHQGKRNLYFHVNPVREAMDRKASKEDIANMAWLHVDVDPRAGEEFEEERKRALRVLRAFKPKPTVIVDSGGGFQGFWKLNDNPDLIINGSISKAQELEAYNIQIEKILQADHCHNVDRIMRIPGTINVPTKRKRAKGRKPALAQLVEWNDVSYDLKEFTPAVRVQTKESGLGGGRPRIKIAGNVADIGTDELRAWAAESGRVISDHTLALIATGEDPMDPTRYPSRSEALFRVVCDLIRAELPDEKIFAVITGSNEIANSVRDKPNWEAYALRQIERAHEYTIEPTLAEFNEKHAVISDSGGRCRIISEVWDAAMKRHKISKQSFEDFRNRYRNRHVVVGHDGKGQPITKAAGNYWIDHPLRRQYETIVFSPGREIDDAYNMWRGFTCDSLPGNKHESFLVHLRDNVCSGNLEYYTYLVGWMARLVQTPDSPGEVAVVLRGKRGTGKSFFIKSLGGLFGRHYLAVSDSKHLVGSFNAHLRDTVLLFGDEAFFAGDKKHESVLKFIITEEHRVVEGKGVDAETAPNYVHLALASNEDWVVPAGLDERRFLVLDVGSGHRQDWNYFKSIMEDLADGGQENLLHFLLTYDLSQFEVRRVPQTKALQDQKVLSMNAETLWFFNKLQEGRLLQSDSEWRDKILKDSLYTDYLNDMKDQGRPFRLSKVAFWKFMQRALPAGFPMIKQEMTNVPWVNEQGYTVELRRRAYICYLPSLKAVREHWDGEFGGPFEWHEVELGEEEEVHGEDIPF